MEKLTLETKEIMNERFGKDNIIAIATVKDGEPYVRNVNGFYENGAFYIITHARSNKMKQIEENTCILCIQLTDGILFSHGTRYNIDFLDN